jgi:hypothetical protein
MSKNKTATLFALFLMLAMAISLVALPSANAHTPPWAIPTYAFMEVNPSPVGVGQTAYVNFWIDKVPPTAIGLWGTRWHNFKVTVTTPKGDTVDLGTFDSDATGGSWTTYVPDTAGTYTFKFSFPGQVAQEENPYPYNQAMVRGLDYINDTYEASSASTTLTVQEQQIVTAYPPIPLPTQYWTRPINSMNRNWYSIGGNWLGLGASIFGSTGTYSGGARGTNFNPYTTAPNSAHVLWTQPIAFGGQIGGEFGDSETGLYATGTAYENKFGAVILYGILYYTDYPGAANDMGPLTAVDLRTGQTLWTVNASNPLRCGMVYNFITGDQYGAHAYLFTAPASYGLGFIVGSTPNIWSMYDAMTGQWVLNIANPHPGTLVEGPNGELLSYNVVGGQLSLWNASKCIAEGAMNLTFSSYSPAEIWRPPQGATIDWNGGYEWSVPVATDISGVPITLPPSISAIDSDVILMTSQDSSVPGGSQTGYRIDAGYSAVDGHLLWGPVNRTLAPFTNKPLGPAGEGVYTEYTCQTMTWIGYDIKTGSKLWGPTKPYNSTWGYFDNNAKGVIGYGNLYVWSLDGEVYAYNVQTGDLNWSWSGGSAGYDTPYGINPLGTWWMQHLLADGKLYVRAGHDYTPPVFKGAKLYCLNATTGDLVWDSLSFNVISSPACADGIMVWDNGYDNQIYAYGMGPTKTTVTAPSVGVTTDTPISISGTITDISAGSQQQAVAANFPNGLPCVSDASMSQWMEFVYQQQPCPANVIGVPVTISVLDSNGNQYDIGTAMSDGSGTYSLTWTPEIDGNFTVYASFAGSNSYYGSSAEAHFYASAAPAATPAPTSPPASMADIYILPGIIAIIIAIAVATIVIVLMLRKR